MSRNREYETAIAESPVRHAIFNKPFSSLRKRTEVLLDTITGGTLSPDVLDTERKQKEADRSLKCRGCRVLFGDERGLNGHYNLFPAHINPPEHKSKPKKKRTHRSQSMSDVLSAASVSTDSQRRPKATHLRSETAVIEQTTSAVLASDFYAPPAVVAPIPAPVYRRPLPQLPEPTMPQPDPTPVLPASAPLLPALDFDPFKLISKEGTIEPESKPRRIQKQNDNSLMAYEERNKSAGAASAAAKVASLREERERRTMTRGGSESALDKISMPTSFGGVVRAVVATGTTGPMGGAVSPSQSPSLVRNPGSSYMSLGDADDDDELEKMKKKSTNKTVSPPSSPGNWSGLFSALPGAPEEEKKRIAKKPIEPIKTGLTSFSSPSEDQLSSPTSQSSTPSKQRKILPRRNTNPFLNEAFMSSLSLSKTPPLSPTSPLGKLSPGNPFARLYSAEEEEGEGGGLSNMTPATRAEAESSSSFLDSSDLGTIAFASPPKEAQGLGLAEGAASPSRKSRGVRFDREAALKASDNPRCPSCQRAFADLEGVLGHLDRSDCNPYDAGQGHAIYAL